jgi:sigma-B regulation protein RsbU (phosphoserine phosphatase)
MRCLWLLCLSLSLYAQTVDISNLGTGTVSLAGQWKFHPGDDPRWADPNFDDSSWKLVKVPVSLSEQGYPNFSGYGWYRLTLQCEHTPTSDLVLKSGGIESVDEFFANGLSLGRFGTFPPHPRSYVDRPMPFKLPASGWGPNGRIVLAVRVWKDPRFVDSPWSGLTGDPPSVGTPLAIQAEIDAQRYRTLFGQLWDASIGGVELLVAFYLVVLCFSHNRRPEYLWFALGFSCDAAATAFRWFGLRTGELTALQTLYGVALLNPAYMISYVKGLWSLYGVAVSRPLQALLVAHALSSVWIIVSIVGGHARYVLSPTLLNPTTWCQLFTQLAIAVFLLRRLHSGPSEVRWFTFLFVLKAIADIVRIIAIFGGAPWLSPSLFRTLNEVFALASVIAIGYLLMRRFGQAQRERLETEVRAAREIQSLLLPAPSLSLPGFQVETVYLPAQEVGGDFFQIATASDGSLLLAIGDVSGKGLRAALTVSLVVGLWKEITASASSPAEILTRLNRHLEGSVKGGFVTCLCARLASDGRLTMANAGHLAPYLNGTELTTKNGLPLGIMAQSDYEDSQHLLAARDTLVFVSDGVVEARDKTRNLFGFERLQQVLSERLGADSIARRAQKFGQEDDITVISVSRQIAAAEPAMQVQAASLAT